MDVRLPAALALSLASAALEADQGGVLPGPPPSFPLYRKAEVARHKTSESGVWVTYRDGVYDVTDFVRVHPGGNKILLAAG